MIVNCTQVVKGDIVAFDNERMEVVSVSSGFLPDQIEIEVVAIDRMPVVNLLITIARSDDIRILKSAEVK